MWWSKNTPSSSELWRRTGGEDGCSCRWQDASECNRILLLLLDSVLVLVLVPNTAAAGNTLITPVVPAGQIQRPSVMTSQRVLSHIHRCTQRTQSYLRLTCSLQSGPLVGGRDRPCVRCRSVCWSAGAELLLLLPPGEPLRQVRTA